MYKRCVVRFFIVISLFILLFNKGDAFIYADDGDSPIEVIVDEFIEDFDNPASVRSGINKAFIVAGSQATEDAPVIVKFSPNKEYRVDGMLFVFSNTIIEATDATIRAYTAANFSLVKAVHTVDGLPPSPNSSTGNRCDAEIKDECAPCPFCESSNEPNYTLSKNITINGGKWIASGAYDSSKNSQCFLIRHSSNITFNKVYCEGNTNHAMNLSGSSDVLVNECHFSNWVKYTGNASEVTIAGPTNIEAIHLDTIGDGESAYPEDGAPCKNITVYKCVFDGIPSGVGRHGAEQYTDQNIASNIEIKECTFNNISFVDGNTTKYGNSISFKNGDNIRVLNNTLNHVGSFVYFHEGVTNVTVDGNVVNNIHGVQGNNQHILWLCKGSSGSITNNILSFASSNISDTLSGIYVNENTETVNLSGNTINGAPEYGLHVVNAKVVSNGDQIIKSGNYAVYLDAPITGTDITEATIKEPGQTGIYVRGGGETTLSKNNISDSANHGIAGSGAVLITSENQIIKPGSCGIWSDNSKVVSTNDSIRSSTSNSINIKNPTSGSSIIGATISNAGNSGIYVTGGGKASYSGNTITKAALNGIHLADPKAGTVASDNTINSPGKYGIYVAGGGQTTLSSNNISNSVEHGIEGSSAILTTSENTVDNSGKAGILGSNAKIVSSYDTVTNSKSNAINLSNPTEGSSVTKATIDNSGGVGIYVSEGGQTTLSSNTITGGVGNGISANGALISSSGNNIKNVGGSGIYGKNTKFNSQNDVIYKPKSYGVQLTNPTSGSKINKAKITSPAGAGVYLNEGGGAHVTNNTIETPGAHGIWAKNTVLASSNNTITKPGNCGIYVDSGKITSENDTIINSTGNGMSINKPRANSKIDNASITKAGGSYGMYIVDANGITITNNDIRDCANLGMGLKKDARSSYSAIIQGNHSIGNKGTMDYYLNEGHTADTIKNFKNNHSGPPVEKRFNLKNATLPATNGVCMELATVTGVKDKPYTGKEVTQNPVVKINGVTLKKDVDYTLSYKNNVKVGNATVIIKGKGNYADSISKSFKIVEHTTHTLTHHKAKSATCGAAGNKEYWSCSVCDKLFSDSKGTTATTKTAVTIAATGKHKWDKGKVTKAATTSATGVRTYTCTVCKATKKETIPKLPIKDAALRRIVGSDRYLTSLDIAESYMKDSGQSKAGSVIIASGKTFPDALAASYLSKAKKAPILMWKEGKDAQVQNFIKKNVKSGGTVYLLGGSSVVGDSIKKGLSGYKFIRIADSNRYGTDIKVMETAGFKKDELLVCDGTQAGNGIYALIASGTGKPVFLVPKGGLTDQQKTWLSKNKSKITKFTILGNTSSVDATVEKQLKSYGTVRRIKAANADELSAKVASEYFKNPTDITVAVNTGFADGLCGGTLAIANKGPIMLVNNSSYSKSVAYTKNLKEVKRVTVLGGTSLVSDEVTRKIGKNSKAKFTVISKK